MRESAGTLWTSNFRLLGIDEAESTLRMRGRMTKGIITSRKQTPNARFMEPIILRCGREKGTTKMYRCLIPRTTLLETKSNASRFLFEDVASLIQGIDMIFERVDSTAYESYLQTYNSSFAVHRSRINFLIRIIWYLILFAYHRNVVRFIFFQCRWEAKVSKC